MPCIIRDVHLAIQAERASCPDRIANDFPDAIDRFPACSLQVGMIRPLLIVKNVTVLVDDKTAASRAAWIGSRPKIGHNSCAPQRKIGPAYAHYSMGPHRSQCVFGHLDRMFERAFPAIGGILAAELQTARDPRLRACVFRKRKRPSERRPVGNRRGLEVGTRAAVCATTMFSFRSIHDTQCRDLVPLWGKEKPRKLCASLAFTQCNLNMSDYVPTIPSTSCADPLACTRSGCGRFAITAN
jgi:hypothetical protein